MCSLPFLSGFPPSLRGFFAEFFLAGSASIIDPRCSQWSEGLVDVLETLGSRSGLDHLHHGAMAGLAGLAGLAGQLGQKWCFKDV